MSEQHSQLAVPVTHRDHALGPPDAVVTLVEYGDFECPHCGQAYPVVKEIKARLGDALRVVYRHFPLTETHPHAELAAESAEAAGAQRQFWKMHDTLFENQDRLEAPDILQYARALGLDLRRFEHDLTSRKYAERVSEDFIGGVRSGVHGTPTFFINGQRHEGSYELPILLAAVVDAAERASGRIRAPQHVSNQFFPPSPGG